MQPSAHAVAQRGVAETRRGRSAYYDFQRLRNDPTLIFDALEDFSGSASVKFDHYMRVHGLQIKNGGSDGICLGLRFTGRLLLLVDRIFECLDRFDLGVGLLQCLPLL